MNTSLRSSTLSCCYPLSLPFLPKVRVCLRTDDTIDDDDDETTDRPARRNPHHHPHLTHPALHPDLDINDPKSKINLNNPNHLSPSAPINYNPTQTPRNSNESSTSSGLSSGDLGGNNNKGGMALPPVWRMLREQSQRDKEQAALAAGGTAGTAGGSGGVAVDMTATKNNVFSTSGVHPSSSAAASAQIYR